MRRLSSHGYVGPARYALTFCTLGRRLLFTSDTVVAPVRSQIPRTATSFDFDVVAYCFMPDHLHLLVEAGGRTSSLVAFVKAAKQASGYHAKVVLGEQLWQTGYFERVMRSDQETKTVALSVVQNPVRAGLVADASDYPYTGSSRYSVRELITWLQDVDSRPT
ncbi:MAG: transposase [Vicinamibacterales bacterium]